MKRKGKNEELSELNSVNEQNLDKTVFHEDDDTIEFKVECGNDDFGNETSDGSDDDHNSEDEDGEIHDESERGEPEVVMSDTGSKSNDCEPEGKKRKRSVNDQIESLTSAVVTMQNMMMQKGFYSMSQLQPSTSKQGKNVRDLLNPKVPENGYTQEINDGTNSETTIYHNAVKKAAVLNENEDEEDSEISFKLKWLRDSTSSEEQGDMSDEMVETDIVTNLISGNQGN